MTCRKFCFLMSLVLVLSVMMPATAQANLLTNGDFEDPLGGGWTQWWGGNSNKYVPDPLQPDNCAGVWWSDDGIFQGIVMTPGTYTVSGDLLDFSGLTPLVDRIAIIQVEIGDGVNIWWIQSLVLDPLIDPLDTWISGSTVVDNTVAGATWMNINLFLIDTGPLAFGIAHWDNIEVIPEPTTMALLGLGSLMLLRKRRRKKY